MARRIFAGLMPDGSYDVRISRPGFDAKTADVNDPKKISFAASRIANAFVSEVVSIANLNTWVSFTKSYSDVPRPLVSILRNGETHFLPFEQGTTSFTGVGINRAGTLYVPVMRTNQMMITVPPAGSSSPVNAPAGDTFVVFLIG